jgi:hypothetical protein
MSYSFESPNVETKEAVELAYSRRSKPFDLQAVDQEYLELAKIAYVSYYNSRESVKQITKREKLQDEAQTKLHNLLQDILEDAIYDFNRLDEILNITIKEIKHHRFFTIHRFIEGMYEQNYGYRATFRDKDVKQTIELQTNLALITQQMDIVYKIFVREYLRETIQNLTNRLTFLRRIEQVNAYDNRFNFLYKIFKDIHSDEFNKISIPSYRHFLAFEPKMRDMVDIVFSVPSYQTMFFSFDQPEVFTRQDLPVNRLPEEFEQDRATFAFARDIEPTILQYLIQPKTEEDLQWEQERQDQWNEQIRMIGIIETQVIQQHSLTEYAARRDWNRDIQRRSPF